MPNDHHPSNTGGVGYEQTDANPRGLMMFAVGLVAILVLTFILMVGTFQYFAKSQSLGDPASPVESERVLPPMPRLQGDPRVDLQKFREQESANVNSYQMVNPKSGMVKIPVDRAMDLLLEKGLPVQGQASRKE